MKRALARLSLAVISGVVFVQCSLPQDFNQASFHKISPVVQKWMAADKTKFSVMVTLKEQVKVDRQSTLSLGRANADLIYRESASLAQKSQSRLVEFLNERNVKFQQFHIVNMLAIENADAKLVGELANFKEVEKVIADPVVKSMPKVFKSASGVDNEPNGIEGNIASIGASKVWEEFGNGGQEIVVAGQDTGVEWEHAALQASYRGWDGEKADHNYNWHDAIHEKIGEDAVDNPCGYNSAVPCDDNEHGTHTIGTVVGDDGKGNQIGVAPKAKWMACHNMDQGVGRPSTYIECFEWFLAPYPAGGDPLTDGDTSKAPHVINNSWGCPEDEGCVEAETLPVLEKLKAAGIFVVASAGNEGSGCETIANAPAMHSDTTLSVGAHNHRDDSIAFFSSRGPSKFDAAIGPDVTAPGVNIRSSVPGGEFSGTFWSGTSMAGPHLVGVVALMWAANESLIGQIDATADIIRKTARPTTSTQTCGGVEGTAIPNNTFGHGMVDAYKAVVAAKEQQ